MNKLTKDRLAGALLVATGAAAVFAGFGYGMGTLRAMGSGFYPVVLGVLLVLIGAVLLAALMTALGVVVFHYGLHLLLPLFTW